MSDVLGVGRIVDEASEVLDSLDRPLFSRTTVERIGRKTVTHSINFSKLDLIFLTILISIFVMALEHRLSTGESWAHSLFVSMTPFQSRLLGSGMVSVDSEGSAMSGIQKASTGAVDTGILTALSPVAGFIKLISDMRGG